MIDLDVATQDMSFNESSPKLAIQLLKNLSRSVIGSLGMPRLPHMVRSILGKVPVIGVPLGPANSFPYAHLHVKLSASSDRSLSRLSTNFSVSDSFQDRVLIWHLLSNHQKMPPLSSLV